MSLRGRCCKTYQAARPQTLHHHAYVGHALSHGFLLEDGHSVSLLVSGQPLALTGTLLVAVCWMTNPGLAR